MGIKNSSRALVIPALVEKHQSFLDALAVCGNVMQACQQSALSRSTAYRLRKTDPEFAAAWNEAVEVGNDALEDEAIRRAFEGVEEDVWYGGEKKGTTRKYSDSLLVFLLKARRPEKFRDAAHGADDDRPQPVIRVSVRGRNGEDA